MGELDVRGLPKPDKHPAIFAAYERLPVGTGFVLVNDHDPKHLRAEFEAAFPGGYGWDYVESGPRVWRIRISKLASTALPRVLANTAEDVVDTESTVVWRLQPRERDLDSNVIALPPDGVIEGARAAAAGRGMNRRHPRETAPPHPGALALPDAVPSGALVAGHDNITLPTSPLPRPGGRYAIHELALRMALAAACLATNVLTRARARRRVLDVRRRFGRHRTHLAAVALIARNPHPDMTG